MPEHVKKVVLVDYEPDILEAIQAMLEDEGYSVVATDRGEEVEAISLSEQPDLIVLDMLLSGKDGREIARQLKSQESTKHIPILMLSAHPRAAKEAQAFEVNDFLAKPFEMDDLLAKVAQYCECARQT
ncbi:MAG: response regulator transcription factor [Ktedonobacteraceae bacterium]|nr:response regulator transcription factor [Ktedonobacteraceae bacterium]